MSTKKLYALTDDHVEVLKVWAGYGLYISTDPKELGETADAFHALAPIDADAAVERMAGAAFKARYEIESFTWAKAGLFRESYRKDARAAFDALLGGEQK